MASKTPLAGWGNYPIGECYASRPERYHQLAVEQPVIARGLGRSYGDAAINTDRSVLLMERLNRFVAFDERTGVVRAEAGVSLADILKIFVPRGWFLPVTPGTKFVTLGGCVACDVHGKNHHIDGSFGDHVREIDLLMADGARRRCSPLLEPDLFWATVGGMGLTGIITEVALQLIPIESAYMVVKHHVASNLEEAMELLSSKEADDKYSVAWIDCLATGIHQGRSIVMNGHHAKSDELSINMERPLLFKKRRDLPLPMNLPSWVLNPWTIKLFNAFYYRSQGTKTEPFITDYDRYFYPLDAIHGWNKMYGKRGFIQYQCVIPTATAKEGMNAILQELVASRRSSFLAVLKRFGPEGKGHLSFPMEGFTLALDIPVANAKLFPFLDHLDEIILHHGGRVYLAKDARLKPDAFRTMYPRFNHWQHIKNIIDPDHWFTSNLSRRLQIGGSSL